MSNLSVYEITIGKFTYLFEYVELLELSSYYDNNLSDK